MATQHIATLLGATCCVRLATVLWHIGCSWLKWDHFQTWANSTQHVTTHRNTVVNRQQCCDMLRWHVAIVWPRLINLRIASMLEDEISLDCQSLCALESTSNSKNIYWIIKSFKFWSWSLYLWKPWKALFYRIHFSYQLTLLPPSLRARLVKAKNSEQTGWGNIARLSLTPLCPESSSNSKKTKLLNPLSFEVGAYIELKALIENAFILPSSLLLSSLLPPFYFSISWSIMKSSEIACSQCAVWICNQRRRMIASVKSLWSELVFNGL